MALYHEAADYLSKAEKFTDSLSSHIYGNKSLKSKPAQVYALVVEAAKWSAIVSGVIEQAGLLKIERKLTPHLAIVLVHDILLAKQGIALPKEHGLRASIERHKARLNSEFTKARLKARVPSVEAWRGLLSSGEDAAKPENSNDNNTTTSDEQPPQSYCHPRWIRLNTLSPNYNLSSIFPTHTAASLATISSSTSSTLHYHCDTHIPHLLALPPGTSVTKHPAYRTGVVILQDKASCFPAYLLDPSPQDGDIIDACAAPGNKTTHLAALLCESRASRSKSSNEKHTQTVYACERDPVRSSTLKKMTSLANTSGRATIECLAGQDFLRLNPQEPRFANVGALLLDPSCSGSGIVGRDGARKEGLKVVLPGACPSVEEKGGRGRKRKRKGGEAAAIPLAKTKAAKVEIEEEEQDIIEEEIDPAADAAALQTRLTALSTFQLKIVLHAFSFPAAKKVVYSTCSVHAEENENVVVKALSSPVARARGWRVMRREEQVDGMKRWDVRGVREALDVVVNGDTEIMMTEKQRRDVAEACIRCEKGTKEGTMGFFVCGFIRDGSVEEEFKFAKVNGGAKKQKVDVEVSSQSEQKDDADVDDDEGKEDNEQDEDWSGFESD